MANGYVITFLIYPLESKIICEISQYWGEKQNAVMECEVNHTDVEVKWKFKGKDIRDTKGKSTAKLKLL